VIDVGPAAGYRFMWSGANYVTTSDIGQRVMI
jgi:hypothetical protein